MSNNPRERGASKATPPPPPTQHRGKPPAFPPAPPKATTPQADAPSRDLASAADVLNPEALIGMMVGPFRLMEIIGYGGFGVVYLAEHAKLSTRFALKLVRALQKHDSDLLKRFQREANLLAALHHPNIVRITDFGQIGEHGLYFAMEYLQGRDLKETLIDDYPLSIERVRGIMGQMCDALRYMHSKRIYHRDLKPANVILVPQGGGRERVKLIDFGIASTVSDDDTSLTQTGMLMGSMPYISPEQARGDSALIDGRADLYSLGIMLYQLLTQQLPYQSAHIPGMITHHLFTPPPSLSKYRPEQEWSPALDAFIQRALSKKPDDRFPTAAVFWNELLQAFSTQPEFDRASLSTIDPLVDDSVEAIMLTPIDEEDDAPLPEMSDSIETMLHMVAQGEQQPETPFPWGEDPNDVEVTSLLSPDMVEDLDLLDEADLVDEMLDEGDLHGDSLHAEPDEVTTLFDRTQARDPRSLMPSLLPEVDEHSQQLSYVTATLTDDEKELTPVVLPPAPPTANALDEIDLSDVSESLPPKEKKGSMYSVREFGIFFVFLLVGGLAAYFLLFRGKPVVKGRVPGALPSLKKDGRAAPPVRRRVVAWRTAPSPAGMWSWRLETLPPGATIIRGAKAVGQTPYTFYGKPKEEIVVTLVRQGFQAKSVRWRLQRKADRILLPLSPIVAKAAPRTAPRVGPGVRKAAVVKRSPGARRARPLAPRRRRWSPPPPPPPPSRSRPRPRPRKRIYDVADPF